MGAGIGCMHYIGMAAMVMQAERLYSPVIFALSIVVAVAMATLALAIRPWLMNKVVSKPLLECISSVVMGMAIASMHYVAMHATVFLPATLPAPGTMVMSKQTLGTLAVVVAVGILILATIAVMMRQRITAAERSIDVANEQTRILSTRLERIASRVPGLVYEFRLGDDGSFTFPYASDAIRDIYRISPEQASIDAMPVMLVLHPDELADHIALADVADGTLVTIELGYGIIGLVDEEQGAPLITRITGIRKQLSRDLGFVLPQFTPEDIANIFEVRLLLEPSAAASSCGNATVEGLGKMKLAVEAGRDAYLAGRMGLRKYADPSSPLAGLI